MLSGDNGVLQRATASKINSEKQGIIEQAKTDILGIITENKGKNITEQQFKDILNIYFDENEVNALEIPDDTVTMDDELTSKNGNYKIKVSEIYSGIIQKEEHNLNWNNIFANAIQNPENYKHTDQSTDTRIAFGQSGNPVNMDLWNVVLGNDGYIIKGSTYIDMTGPHTNPGYKGSINYGKIQGEMPMYVQSSNDVNTFIPVTELESTFSYMQNLAIDPGIPSTVKIIGKYTFYGCSLYSINIPNGVTTIKSTAFAYYVPIKNIVIPSSVINIEDRSALPYNLSTITVENGNTVYDSRNNCNAIIETATNTLFCGSSSTVIPSTVTSIKNNAFDGCNNLRSITIPGNVKSIGSYAFRSCYGLGDVIIQDGVESIGSSAFDGCWGQIGSNSGTIYIPSSVVNVGSSVFYYASSATIYVPFKENERPAGWNKEWTKFGNPTIIYVE